MIGQLTSRTSDQPIREHIDLNPTITNVRINYLKLYLRFKIKDYIKNNFIKESLKFDADIYLLH